MSNNAYRAKVDWITLTFKNAGFLGFEMLDLKYLILDFFKDELGIELTAAPLGKSYLNYRTSFKLLREAFGGESVQAGILAFNEYGDNRKGVNQGLILSLSGAGCHNVDFVYLLKFFALLNPRITRIDFAIDYYDGEVCADDIHRWFQAGYFAGQRGPSPTLGRISRVDKEGLKSGGSTLYVGNRGASRLVRCYDKSYQLASLDNREDMPFADWFRVEFELRPAGRAVIPLECCEDINSFLASVFPYLIPDHLPLPNHSLRVFNKSQHLPLKYINPQFDVSIHHLIHHAKRCYGSLVNVLKNHFNQSSDEIVNALIELDSVPRRLHLPVP